MRSPPSPSRCPPASTRPTPIVIDSTKGRIVIKLRTDLAPQHAERIKTLAREGFYNNVPFHRVIGGFMAQTGDGQNFNGTGGSKYPEPEAGILQRAVQARHRRHGAARRQRRYRQLRSSSSCSPTAPSLNGQYTVIGEVVSGMDVVDNLKKAPPGSSGGSVTDPDKMLKVQVASDIK